MRNQYKIESFTQDHLEPATHLLIETYKKEQESSPLLPPRTINEPEWITSSLEPLVPNSGVAIMLGDKLVAFMLNGFRFPFKGQNARQIPEFCHSSVQQDKQELYQIMYMHLAEGWVKNHDHLHIIAHFAHDSLLQNTLFKLGFGVFLTEELRDFSDITNVPLIDIVEETDVKKLVDIEVEHMNYYRHSPIFLARTLQKDEILTKLEASIHQGVKYFVYYEDKEPCAYMTAKESANQDGDEGFLLRNTNTAQIKSAYVKEHIRRKGVGKALLQRIIDWSAESGYERLFVEHETANYYGGNFWTSYFTPYLCFSMRYIDNTI